VVLMGVTNKLCLDVASAPFLWILPLATYLVTFILCFGSERAYRRAPFVALTILAVGSTLGRPVLFAWLPAWIMEIFSSAPGQIFSYCVLLFGVAMIMHGEIYRLRPPSRDLTVFYLCVSAGGALGGLFVGIAAPLLFTDYYEFPLGLALAWLLLLFVCAHDPSSALNTNAPRWRWGMIGSLTLAGLVYGGWTHFAAPDSILHQERNFFGVLRVTEKNRGTKNHHLNLYHGTTLHGVQLQQGERRAIPTSYFGRATTIGLVMSLREKGSASRVGVIGLGAGTLAAYGQRGDLFRFYEIDPAVVHIARDDGYFDFLGRSRARIEVVLGDARLSLAREKAQGVEQDFDILVLDAFSGDAIPIHLLTREGFDQYNDALAGDGLLAVHVSNRYFDLMSLVARQGMESGMDSLRVKTIDAQQFQSRTSKWVLLSRDANRIAKLSRSLQRKHESMGLDPAHIRVTRSESRFLRHIGVWTDDFSNLFSQLKPLNFHLR
jgi:spermidine synthase